MWKGQKSNENNHPSCECVFFCVVRRNKQQKNNITIKNRFLSRSLSLLYHTKKNVNYLNLIQLPPKQRRKMVSICENTATWIDRTIEAMKKCQKTILQFQTERKKNKKQQLRICSHRHVIFTLPWMDRQTWSIYLISINNIVANGLI